MNKYIEIPATKQSIAQRKSLFGVGTNDADYMTNQIVNGKRVICPFYRKWANMLNRCYSQKYQKTRPTYIGCSVTEDWLLFSNFKTWMQSKNWHGKHLDKDVINKDNKVYSACNCCFISLALNSLLNDSKAIRGIYPQGVSFHKHIKKYMAGCYVSGKKKHLGYFATIKEASNVYKRFKAELITKIANEQTDIRIKNGLLSHADILLRGNP